MSKRVRVDVDISDDSKRPKSCLFAASSVPSRKKVPQYLRIGSEVRINYYCAVAVHYETEFRANKKHLMLRYKGSYGFSALPEDWDEVIRQEIISKHMEEWKKQIYKTEGFYGTFDSWKVTIQPAVKLHDIETTAIDVIKVEDDDDFLSP